MLRKILSMALNKEMPIEEILQEVLPDLRSSISKRSRPSGKSTRSTRSRRSASTTTICSSISRSFSRTRRSRPYLRAIPYVMVDEFQDTNTMQGDITYYLAQRHGMCSSWETTPSRSTPSGGRPTRISCNSPIVSPGAGSSSWRRTTEAPRPYSTWATRSSTTWRNRYEKCLRAVKKENGEKPYLIYFSDGYEEAVVGCRAGEAALRRGHGAVPPVHLVPVCLHNDPHPGRAEQEEHPLRRLRGAQVL